MIELGREDDETLVACVADGAGTAALGAEGSAIACETIVHSAESYFQAKGGWDLFEREDALCWCETARERLRTCAQAHDCGVREVATTLCVAVISPLRAAFFQVGDGAIVINHGGVYGVVFWPQSGEYANSTNFLTSDLFHEHLEFRTAPGRFSNVALFTDGLERLALQFGGRVPHGPFFEPLFGALRTGGNSEQLGEELRRFLQSESMRSRSDDDKSLILASRISRDSGTSA